MASSSSLEDELRHVLTTQANDLNLDSLLDLSSLSLSPSEFIASDPEDNQDPATSPPVLEATISIDSSSRRRRSSRSMPSIREIEIFSPDSLCLLRTIVNKMFSSGYATDCTQVYVAARKPFIEKTLRQLGVENLTIVDVQRLEWDAVEIRIRKWIRSAKICVRIIFASELALCESVFGGILGEGDDGPFVEIVKGATIQLFGFADAVSVGRRSPEKLFKILELHDALSELLPDIASIFGTGSGDSVYTNAVVIVSQLAEAVRGIVAEFENAVLREPSKTPVPGGTIHPLTRYVMNYISLISDYKLTLTELIVTRPSVGPRITVEDPSIACPLLPDIDIPEIENRTPLASHLIWIIAVLQHNLEGKSKVYKDTGLSHLFLMNNVHYIVNKVKGLPELREMIGDDYLRKLTGKFRLSATSYQRASWVKVLHCLRDEGIHVSGSFSSGVSKSTLRERFKTFNATFDEVHRTQSAWSVPDEQLSEELRISISEKLLPAYRSFLGRFRQHIESGRHPEMYIKYSVEDLETALSDFFLGIPPSALSRKRSH